MSRNKSYIRQGFLVGFVFSAIVAVATSAFAKFEQHSAGACKLSHYAQGDAQMDLIYDWEGRVHNFSDRDAFFICDVPDTDRLRKENISNYELYVSDGSTTRSVVARACVTSFTGTSGGCGAATFSGNSFTGDIILRPSLSKWSSVTTNDFGYVRVELPRDAPPAGGDTSLFHGYFLSGN